MQQMYPLKFEPILKPVLWGGSKILRLKNKECATACIGESWELSGVPGDISVVSNGIFKGRTIESLLKEYQMLIVGEAVWNKFGTTFPLLIKFIDAGKDLSIQVHPDDDIAQQRHACLGKTELWYILESEENAYLYSGFSKRITKSEFLKKIETNTVTEVLNKFNTARGDIFYLPAGRVHSIGAGNFLVEIQQTSNITYRVYDYDRVDSNGKKRELHTDLAKDSIDYNTYDDYRSHLDPETEGLHLIKECSTFAAFLLKTGKQTSLPVKDKGCFKILICIDGEAEIVDNNGYRVNIQRCETVLLPYSLEHVLINPIGGCVELIVVHIENGSSPRI